MTVSRSHSTNCAFTPSATQRQVMVSLISSWAAAEPANAALSVLTSATITNILISKAFLNIDLVSSWNSILTK